MSGSTATIETFANQEYKWGFVTDIEADAIPRGLNEDIIRLISAKNLDEVDPELLKTYAKLGIPFRRWK